MAQKTASSKRFCRTNDPKAIVKGMKTTPTKRSATAKLERRIVDVLFNARLVFTAMITKMFKRMIAGQVTEVIARVI